jgi:hypothetical protein
MNRRPPSRAALAACAAFGAIVGLAVAAPAAAQTDFYGLDKGRPLRVEDAYTAKRHAFELQFAPLTLAQDRTGALHYQPSLELKHGLLPGLELSAGWGLETLRRDGESSSGAAPVDLSALLNLWVEGATLPAAGLRATGHLATRDRHHSSLELRGIVTRTLGGPVRAHLNGAVVMSGEAPDAWWGGLALDWVLPFRHTLLLAEGWVATPSDDDADRTLHTAAGVRYQVSPVLVLDAGVGRGWSGGDAAQDWSLTLGLSREFGLRALIPGAR